MHPTRTSPSRRHDHLRLADARFELLERRVLFTGTALYLTEVTTAAGLELSIDGSPGDDRISVVAYGDSLTLANKGGWWTTVPNHFALIHINAARGHDVVIVDGSVTTGSIVRGSNGDDTIMGGAGDDRIYGGFGRDRILGGAGDDTIVSIGDSVQDRVSGDAGFDSFWTDSQKTEVVTDASPEERAAGAVHRVDEFLSPPQPVSSSTETSTASPFVMTRDLGAQDLPDPQAAASAISVNFADSPLFADAGPTEFDIAQGQVGDCYLLATLAAVAKQEPTLIRQSIAELGDGTYAIRFKRGDLFVYVRVDADLPAYTVTSPPMYAKLGVQGSLWAALIEKGYAFFRTGAGTYGSLQAGWMSEVFDALGTPSQAIWRTGQVPPDLLAVLKTELDAGAAITWATNTVPAGVPLVASHAYSVESITLDASGVAISVTFRNPWGKDGGGSSDGANDGLVTLRRDQIGQAFSAIMYARV